MIKPEDVSANSKCAKIQTIPGLEIEIYVGCKKKPAELYERAVFCNKAQMIGALENHFSLLLKLRTDWILGPDLAARTITK